MIEHFDNRALDVLFSVLLASAALAIVAEVVTRASRFPRLAYALWLLVVLKLFVPPMFVLQLPILPRLIETPIATAPVASSRSDSSRSMVIEYPLDSAAGRTARAAGQNESAELPLVTSTAAVDTIEPRPIARVRVSRVMVALSIWGGGVVILLTVSLFRIWRFDRLLRQAKDAEGWLQELTLRLTEELQLTARPRVFLVDASIPPIVWRCGWRPRIYLPSKLVEQLNRSSVEKILLQELSHLQHRDHWVQRLSLPACSLYWWNPFVWLAARRLRHLQEVCCDLSVIRRRPDERVVYADALVATLELISERTFQPVSSLLAFGGVGNYGDRVQSILRGKIPRKLSGWRIAALLLLSCAVLMTSARVIAQTVNPAKPKAIDKEQQPKAASATIDTASLKQLLADTQQTGTQWAHIPRIAAGFSAAGQFDEALAALNLVSPSSSNKQYRLNWKDYLKQVDALVADCLKARDAEWALRSLESLDAAIKSEPGESGTNYYLKRRQGSAYSLSWSRVISYLAMEGESRKALELVDPMPAVVRDKILVRSLRTLRTKGHLEAAEEVATKIADPDTRGWNLREIGAAALREKRSDFARNLALELVASEHIDIQKAGAELLARVAADLWRQDEDQARAYLKRAETILLDDDDPETKPEQKRLAFMLADQGIYAEAKRLSKDINPTWNSFVMDPERSAHPMMAAIRKSIAEGELEQALEFSREFKDSRARIYGLRSVATELKSQDRERAKQIAAELVEIIQQLPRADAQPVARVSVPLYGTFSLLKDLEMRKELEAFYANGHTRREAEPHLLALLTELRDYEAAMSLARPYYTDPKKRQSLERLAKDLRLAHQTQLFEEIMDVLSNAFKVSSADGGTPQIPKTFRNPKWVYRRVAKAAYDQGDKDLAVEMLLRMEYPVMSPSAGTDICWVARKKQDYEFIERMLKLDNPRIAKQAMRPAVYYLLDERKYPRALEIAAQYDRDLPLKATYRLSAELAKMTAKAGVTDIAIKALRQVPDRSRHWSSQRLGEVAAALAKKGESFPQDLQEKIESNATIAAEVRLQFALNRIPAE